MEKRKRKIFAGVVALSLAAALAVGCLVWMRGRGQNAVGDLRFRCDYELEVELEPSENSLVYTERISVSNEGRDSVSELYFRLYANRDLAQEEQVKIISAVDGNGEAVRVRSLEDGALFCARLNAPLEGGGTTELIFDCENTMPVMRVNYGVARDGEIQLASFHLQLAVYDGKGWDIVWNIPAISLWTWERGSMS